MCSSDPVVIQAKCGCSLVLELLTMVSETAQVLSESMEKSKHN